MEARLDENRFVVVAIGSSAGGPSALESIFSSFPKGLPIAVVLSQHMPSGFTKQFADRLTAVSKLNVMEGYDGCRLRPGEVLVAPGGHNMEVLKGGVIRVEKASQPAAPTPSINVMMKSVAQAYGPMSVGVLLTGMLNDGAEGMKAIKESGGITIAQDEASSVVYGMPKAALEAGAVDTVAHISEIPSKIAGAVEIVLSRPLSVEGNNVSR
jgi:two-component system chemotaxis response regulator CheB